MSKKDQIRSRTFDKEENRSGLIEVLHPNRIQKTYNYKDTKTGKICFVVKYYADSKAMREKYNFPVNDFVKNINPKQFI